MTTKATGKDAADELTDEEREQAEFDAGWGEAAGETYAPAGRDKPGDNADAAGAEDGEGEGAPRVARAKERKLAPRVATARQATEIHKARRAETTRMPEVAGPRRLQERRRRGMLAMLGPPPPTPRARKHRRNRVPRAPLTPVLARPRPASRKANRARTRRNPNRTPFSGSWKPSARSAPNSTGTARQK